jgi:glucose uptake protein GlcU
VAGIFSTWSPYVLVVVGAATMLLASHALQAGTLAASQPGFTLADPLVASLLGVFVFRDHLQLHPADIAIEIIAVLLLVGGVITLSHSQLVHGEFRSESSSADPLRSARWADRIAP